MIVGGNLIKYPGEVTTRTTDLITANMLKNRVISTEGARYSCFDGGVFDLETPLLEYEYMRIPLKLFPE